MVVGRLMFLYHHQDHLADNHFHFLWLKIVGNKYWKSNIFDNNDLHLIIYYSKRPNLNVSSLFSGSSEIYLTINILNRRS